MDAIYYYIITSFPLLFGFIGWMIVRNKTTIKNFIVNLVVDVAVRIGTRLYLKQKSATLCGRSLKIPYKYNGVDYVVYVPFARNIRRKMRNTKVFLVKEDGHNKVDISQQPGCPYLITADSLGGEKIEVVNCETGYTHEFEKNVIPEI